MGGGTDVPGAVDAPYDGVDANCDQANDYDADVDGYASEDFSGAEIQLYFQWWGGDSLASSTGDCDDADPDVNPGEVFFVIRPSSSYLKVVTRFSASVTLSTSPKAS